MSPTSISLTQQVLGSDRYEIRLIQSPLTMAFPPAPQQVRRVLSTGAKRDEWPFGYSVYRMLTEPGRPKLVQLPREILLAKLRKDTERWDLPYTDDQMILVFVNEYVSNHIGMRFFHEQWHEIPWAQLPLAEPESMVGTGEESEDEVVLTDDLQPQDEEQASNDSPAGEIESTVVLIGDDEVKAYAQNLYKMVLTHGRDAGRAQCFVHLTEHKTIETRAAQDVLVQMRYPGAENIRPAQERKENNRQMKRREERGLAPCLFCAQTTS